MYFSEEMHKNIILGAIQCIKGEEKHSLETFSFKHVQSSLETRVKESKLSHPFHSLYTDIYGGHPKLWKLELKSRCCGWLKQLILKNLGMPWVIVRIAK